MSVPVLRTGETYHVHGWNFKAQFILESIDDNGIATLKYPKRSKRTRAPASKLFYTKKTKQKLKSLEEVE